MRKLYRHYQYWEFFLLSCLWRIHLHHFRFWWNLRTMHSFWLYALNNRYPSTIYFFSSSSPTKKILSLTYPNLFGSLTVSIGSFWNTKIFYSKVCISFHWTCIFHATISIAIMIKNLITCGGSFNKTILIIFLFQVKLIPKSSFIKNTFLSAQQLFWVLNNCFEFFWRLVNFNTISLSSLLFFLSNSFSFISSSTCDFSCSYGILCLPLNVLTFMYS